MTKTPETPRRAAEPDLANSQYRYPANKMPGLPITVKDFLWSKKVIFNYRMPVSQNGNTFSILAQAGA